RAAGLEARALLLVVAAAGGDHADADEGDHEAHRQPTRDDLVVGDPAGPAPLCHDAEPYWRTRGVFPRCRRWYRRCFLGRSWAGSTPSTPSVSSSPIARRVSSTSPRARSGCSSPTSTSSSCRAGT